MGKEKRKKDKDKSKSKKDKKDKKHKKHKRRSSSDSSDSDESMEGAEEQLQRERAAVNKLRDILSLFPSVRKELREMLWRVDQGEAANISGVPDPELKAQLARLLELLRLRRNDKGVYGLINCNERVLPVVGFVFDEPPRPRPASVPSAPLAPGSGHAKANGGEGVHPKGGSAGGTVTAAAIAAAAAGRPASEGAVGDPVPKAEPDMPPRRTGPVRPQAAPRSGEEQEQDVETELHSSGRCGQVHDEDHKTGVSDGSEPTKDAEQPPPAPVRRVAGPAMPPRELLEAAAAAAEALQSAGPSYDEDSDDDGGLLIGPPPPELVEELEAAPQDEREAEVVRIVKHLHEANAAPSGGPAAAAPSGPSAADKVDAYIVLGVTPAASSVEVKKRYMRLSLLIHPDKCNHPLAHEAFQAVATAAKVLQDTRQRSALDERRADLELRKRAEAAAAQQERERAWRVARGEEVPAAGPVGPSGPQRETWMTELPPEMSAHVGAGGMSQTSVRAFSQRGKTGRGDTSGWTDNPEQRKAREAQALLAAASDAYVRALPAAGGGDGVGEGGGRGAAAAAAMDSFNSASRKKSLMEVHLELQEKAKQEAKAARKAAKKQKTGDKQPGEQAEAGAAEWPWRPFDRDRDLDLKPKAKSGTDILKSAAALGSKFSGGGTQRHFL